MRAVSMNDLFQVSLCEAEPAEGPSSSQSQENSIATKGEDYAGIAKQTPTSHIERVKGTLVPHASGPVYDPHGKWLGLVLVYRDVAWKSSLCSGVGYVQFQFVTHQSSAKNVHWIQFIRRQKFDCQGQPVDPSQLRIWIDPGLWQQRGEWYLDVPAKACSVYYDDCAMHYRGKFDNGNDHDSATQEELSMWDKPWGHLDSRLHSRLLIEVQTYLIADNQVVWRIDWQLEQQAGDGQGVICIVKGGPVDNFSPTIQAMGDQWKIGYASSQKATPETAIYKKRPF